MLVDEAVDQPNSVPNVDFLPYHQSTSEPPPATW